VAKQLTSPGSDDAATGAHVLIIGSQAATLANGVNNTLAHMLNGAKNEYAEIVQRTAQDARDIHDDAKAKGRSKNWARCFMVAPHRMVTREVFLTEVLPLISRMYNFPANEAIVFEHGLRRKNAAASGIHWHLVVSHVDPLSGQARKWSWDYVINERISRTLEVRLGEKIQVGRHQVAVIRALRSDGEHDIADAIERAHPSGSSAPQNRTAKREIEQAAQAKGADLRDVGARVRAAYDAAGDIEEFRELLARSGLQLAVSARVEGRPAWVIHNSAGFLRSLGGALAGTSLKSIKQKIGEPPNARSSPDRNDAGPSGRLGDGNPRIDRAIPEVAAAGPPGVLRVGDQLRPVNQGSVAKIFSSAALNHPVRATALRDRLSSLVEGARAIAEKFISEVVRRARRFISHVAPRKVMQPNGFVLRGREELSTLRGAQERAQNASSLAYGTLLSVTMAPVPRSAAARQAHQARIDAAKKDCERCSAAVQRAKAAVEACMLKNKPFEDHYDARNREYRRTIVADEVAAANRALDVAARVETLIDERPEVLWMGAPALVRYGLIEAKKAAPTARFLVNAHPTAAPDEYAGGGDDTPPAPLTSNSQ
jgi:hypothetical protein